MAIWVLAGFAAFMAMLWLLLIVTALGERQVVLSWHRFEDGTPASTGKEAAEALREALNTGYVSAGIYADGGEGRARQVATLLVSPDQLVLLQVQHGRFVFPYRFLSRTADGRWLATMNQGAVSDRTGLVDEEMILSKHFWVVERYHLERAQRVVESGGELVPFEADRVADDLNEMEEERLALRLEGGLAEEIPTEPGEPRRWKYTFRGALAVGSLVSFWKLKRAAKLAKKKEREWKARKRSRSPAR